MVNAGFGTLLSALILASSLVRAAWTPEQIAKNSALGLHLIDLNPSAEPVWKTEDEILQLIRKKARFFDVTETYDPAHYSKEKDADLLVTKLATYPAPSKGTEVKALTAKASLDNMKTILAGLTAFNNRYYKSSTGQAASVWIRDTLQNITAQYPASGITVSLFSHSFVQSSIIAKIPGKTSGPVTILGAHMDSINANSPTSGRAPGADDDGTGSTNLIEAFRVLVSSGFKPSTPVEFQWYAGEEGGLLGSQAIASNYKSAGVQVKAMLQLDMTAYVRPGVAPTVGLMPDYTDSGLTTFVGQLITAYTTRTWFITAKCGYACSDHASWNRQGYPTALPFEGAFANENPAAHTTSDTVTYNGFNWEHTYEYTKLAIAFAYELAA